MRSFTGLTLIAMSLFFSSSVTRLTAVTNYVCLDGSDTWPYDTWAKAATTIHTALTNAADADVVLVSNGTYSATSPVTGIVDGLAHTGMVVLSKGVILRSLHGASNTFISRSGATAFRIVAIGHSNAVVDGFTIMNGNDGWAGAGVFINTNATLINSIICSNSNPFSGGGIFARRGGTVSNCVIRNNLSRYGGGVYLDSTGTVVNCTFIENSPRGDGNGGAIWIRGGGLVQNCTVVSNGNNSAPGGGINLETGGTVRNSVFAANKGLKGGAIHFNNANSTADCCTVIGNYGMDGSGIFFSNGGLAQNTLVWGNVYGPQVGWNDISKGGLTNCCVPDPAVPGAGLVFSDPLLRDPDQNDFRLRAGSPCIDAGTNQNWMIGATDKDGNPRISGARVDIGAHEYVIGALDCCFTGAPLQGLTTNTSVFNSFVSGTNTAGLYYRWDFNGGGDDVWGPGFSSVTNGFGVGRHSIKLTVTNQAGEIAAQSRANYVIVSPPELFAATDGNHVYPYTSWNDAATNVQAAVDICADGALVRVKAGVYSLSDQIQITRGITLRSEAGFSNTVLRRAAAGTNEPQHRILFLNHTNAIVEGFSLVNGYWGAMPPLCYGGGAYVYGGSLINCAIISNSTISGGTGRGGGVFCSTTGLLENCVFSSNSSPQGLGGGLYTYHGGSLTGCVFTWNRSRWGAGAYLEGVGLMENCSFSTNTAQGDGGGGGIFLKTTGMVDRCVFMTNYAGHGAAAYIEGAGTLRNCLVARNSASDRGGGVFIQNGGLMENCTITTNSGGRVGGIYIDGNGPGLRNNIIFGNTSTNYFQNWLTNNFKSTNQTLMFCCTAPTNGFPGEGHLEADPTFQFAETDDYHLRAESPCLNAGTNQPWMTNSFDLDGNPRIARKVVDIGAYERSVRNGTVFRMK